MNRFFSRKFILAVVVGLLAFLEQFTGVELPKEAVIAALAFIFVEGAVDVVRAKALTK